MADRDHKVPENVPGRYYVDVTCIDCDLCRETAPHKFHSATTRGATVMSITSRVMPPRRPPARLHSRNAPSRPSAAMGDGVAG